MPSSHRAILLGFILLGGFCARAATYRAPLLDHHAWRQADTASISRNFYRERLNILYPQVDQRGSQEHGYVATGLELPAFVVALVSVPIGFHHETGRLLSALLFLGSCSLVAILAGRRYGTTHGLVAAFLYAFGFPLLIYIERAFMNEALLIFLSLTCLVAADRYLQHPRPYLLVLLIGASTLVGLVKLPYLIVWAPIVGLFLERYGSSALRSRALWAMAGVNLAAAAAWYAHIHQASAITGLSFGFTDKLFDAATVFSTEFPRRLSVRFLRDILGPVLLVGVAVGSWQAIRRRRWCETLGLAGYAAYLLIAAVGNHEHDYYQLALMPIAPMIGSVGLIFLADRYPSATRRDVWLAGMLGGALTVSFIRHVSAHSWYEYSREDVRLCDTLRAMTAPTDRIVFADYADPKILFCTDRKGWLLDYETGPGVERALREGAAVAVVASGADDALHAMMRQRIGAPVFTNSSFDVYRIR
jgi:hypothetical protein